MDREYGRYDNIENLGPNYFEMSNMSNFDKEYDSQQYRNQGSSVQHINISPQGVYSPYQQPYNQNIGYQNPYQNIYTKKEESNKQNLVFVQPTDFSSIQNAISMLKQGQMVLLNFSKLNDKVLERVLDYMSGAIFGLSGSMQRVGDSLFVFTPKDVKIQIPMEIINQLNTGNKK